MRFNYKYLCIIGSSTRSGFLEHCTSQQQAVVMMQKRLRLIIEYVNAVKSGRFKEFIGKFNSKEYQTTGMISSP